MSVLIVVSVGTDHHPFDRLVRHMDQWALDHPDDRVVIQFGTAVAPRHTEGHSLIPHPELLELFAQADVVICHGGPSTVMDARIAGKKPLVLPRNPALGEHIDEHQMRFATHLHKHGLANTLDSDNEIDAGIDTVLANPDAYRIAEGPEGAPSGVVQFGAVIDDLLGTKTPLVFPKANTSNPGATR